MRNLELPGRSPVRATGGMAATSHPLSTQAALDVLKSGGNAMDAAVTAVAVQCVVEPQSTGIGGDCFVLYAPKGSADIIAYNGSGGAPQASTPEWFKGQGISEIGEHTPHAVTIPGAIDAWCTLLADHGTISIADALQPAISYARGGFPVHDRVARDWATCTEMLGKDPGTARIYLKDGKPYVSGDIHKQPELAETLEAIATEGKDGFYQGRVAADIVGHLQSLGGCHTLDDFAKAAGQYVDPIKTSYKGYEVHECPPNGQGIAALLLLNIISEMGLDKMNPLSPERLHLFIEAGRMAYAERNACVSDPDQIDVPVDTLLSAGFAARLRDKITPGQVMEAPVAEIHGGDTVYLCVVDKDGNAVSFINSLFQSFGSGIVGPKSGVILQNRGLSFNLDPTHANCIQPGKRPMHTIIPGMVTRDSHAVMPFGVMGGQYQAFGHAYFLSNLFDCGMDLQEAMDLPRLFPAVSGPVEVESGMPKDVIKTLQGYGHKTVAPAKPIGGSQAIWIDRETGVLTGASDPRKDGHAAGY